MVLLALDLHLVHLGMISIIPPAWRQGPWRLHLGCHPNLQYITRIYLQHAGHKEIRKTTIWLLPVVIILQIRSFHTNMSYIKFVTLTISHHMPCKNKLDASNLSLHILRGLGLSKIELFIPTNIKPQR